MDVDALCVWEQRRHLQSPPLHAAHSCAWTSCGLPPRPIDDFNLRPCAIVELFDHEALLNANERGLPST
uniref:Uncharacterized protein n=1 Tax=Arundo donax TaxID=35708 RepID=A0A0A8Y369_ARUDO